MAMGVIEARLHLGCALHQCIAALMHSRWEQAGQGRQGYLVGGCPVLWQAGLSCGVLPSVVGCCPDMLHCTRHFGSQGTPPTRATDPPKGGGVLTRHAAADRVTSHYSDWPLKGGGVLHRHAALHQALWVTRDTSHYSD